MQINTKYFGEIECDEDAVLNFADGLFAFEEEKRFLLIPFADADGSLLCLQSVQTPGLAFIAMNPFHLKADYAPVLQKSELDKLNVSRSEELCFYVLCAVRAPISDSNVNLKCPLAINDDTRQAAQVILETDEYKMRHPLSEFKTGEAGASC